MEVLASLSSRSPCRGLLGKDTTPGVDFQLLMQYLRWVQGQVAPARCGELPLQLLLQTLQHSLGWGCLEHPDFQEQPGSQEQLGSQNLVGNSEGSCHGHLQLSNFES